MIPQFVVGTLLGQWVARSRKGKRVTASHFVESEIAARVVTRCGRQMGQASKRGILFVDVRPGGRCEQCTKRREP